MDNHFFFFFYFQLLTFGFWIKDIDQKYFIQILPYWPNVNLTFIQLMREREQTKFLHSSKLEDVRYTPSMIVWRLLWSVQTGILEKFEKYCNCLMNHQPGMRNMRILLKQMLTVHNFVGTSCARMKNLQLSRVVMGDVC